MIVDTFKVKVYLAVLRHFPAQPFAWSWCLHLLGNFLVACICTWRHFLGVRLYSNSNTGCQNFERVLCLILPSHLVESVSFAILRCQSYLQECVSRGGLFHYSEGSVVVLGSTAALNCLLTQKSVSRMTRGRRRKRYRTSRKSTDENAHSQTGQSEEIATPPTQRTSPRRGMEMNSSDPLQTEESGFGNDIFYAASAVSPNSNQQVQRCPLFTVDCTAKPVPNAAQTLEYQQFEDPESQELFLQCLTPVWHRDICVFAQRFKEYSDEAHLSAVKVAIQYSETLLQSQDDEVPDYESKDEEDDFSCLQNPTKTPIISKDASSLSNYPLDVSNEEQP